MEARDRRAQHLRKISQLRERRKAAGSWCHTLLQKFLNAHEGGTDRAAQVSESTTETHQYQVFQCLPDDLILKIFISLPAESLFRIQFVCKRWFALISNPTFVRFHAQQSQTLIICQKVAFALKHSDVPMRKGYFHLIDFDHARDDFVHSNIVGMVTVLSGCDGLVLVRRETTMSLILTNPVTRKYTELPQNTATTSCNETYSLAFCDKENTYKVVHLFSEQSGCIGCGILSISSRKWKRIEGFSSSESSLPNDRQKMVFVHRSLHWMPRNNARDSFVSLNLQDEKFITRNMPICRQVNDKLLDIGGVLGFVTRETHHLMQVWVLDESNSGSWIKRYSINLISLNVRAGAVPICCPRNGEEMVFSYIRGDHLYAYNFDKGDSKLVYSREPWHESMDRIFIPHRNTLVSWESRQEAI